MTSSGSSAANWGSSPAWRAVIRAGRRHPVGERAGDVLERAVLQQPREEQVARLDEGEVLLVLAGGWGSSRAALMSSSVAATSRNSEAWPRSQSVSAAWCAPDVRDELVGDLRQRDLGDVELVLGDQPEQQVERALEDVEVHLERGAAPRRVSTPPGVSASPRASTRTSATAAAASAMGLRPPHRGRSARGRAAGRPRPRGASRRRSVIGSAARVASGNFTVRLMTVWNTWSPKWSTTLRTTSRLCRVRPSYIVARMPSTWSGGG